MFKRILFATDFSDCAAHAQIYAFAFAARLTAELHIAHVVDTTFTTFAGAYGLEVDVKHHIEEMKQQARQRLTGIADLARGAGLPKAQTHLLVGMPPESIMGEAQRLDSDLLIIGKHGRSGFDLFLGSNAQRIVRYATSPVLAVTAHGREFVHGSGEFTLKRVLCPCDLSPLSEQAVTLAAKICRNFRAELTLLHVIDDRFDRALLESNIAVPAADEIRQRATTALDAIAEKLQDVKVNVAVVAGTPAKQIDEVAHDRSIQLIVMSTHGRGGLSRALLGSTAEKVVRTTLVPTMTIRPT